MIYFLIYFLCVYSFSGRGRRVGAVGGCDTYHQLLAGAASHTRLNHVLADSSVREASGSWPAPGRRCRVAAHVPLHEIGQRCRARWRRHGRLRRGFQGWGRGACGPLAGAARGGVWRAGACGLDPRGPEGTGWRPCRLRPDPDAMAGGPAGCA